VRLTRWWPVGSGALAATGVLAGIAAPELTLAGPGPGVRWVTWAAAFGALVLSAVRSRAEPATSKLLGFSATGLLVAEAAGPGASNSIVFTVASLAGGTAAACAAGSLAVRDRAPGPRRLGLGLSLAAAVLAGPIAALAFDPRSAGCYACRSNLLALIDSPRVAHRLAAIGAVTAIGAVAWSAVRVLRSTGSGTPRWVNTLRVMATSMAVTVLAAVAMVGAPARSTVGTCRLLASLGLLVAAACLCWEPWNRHRRRRALAALVARFAAASSADTLEHAIGAALGDPTLRILYPFDDGTMIDGRGRPVETTSVASTVLERDGEPVALVWHVGGVFEGPREVDVLAATVGLALDQERQAAVLAARANVLAATRRRLIETSDAARRSLERDLHDHAQQRLVSVLLALRLELGHHERADEGLGAVFVDVREALEQVRSISHGVFPITLADGGLSSALEELALNSPRVMVDERIGTVGVSPVIEATAYLIASRCAEDEGAVSLTVTVEAGRLRLEAEFAEVHDATALADLESRALALGGRWTENDRRVEVELPCGW
jgi:signal transduction histidine kinase